MLTADEIRRRIEWLVPKGVVSDIFDDLGDPWTEEYDARWGGLRQGDLWGLRVSPNVRRFIDKLDHELAAVGATLMETAYAEYPGSSPATQLRVIPAYDSDTQVCYVLSKIVDMAFGAAMIRRAYNRVDVVSIESVFPEYQKEHETVLRVMAEFGVECIEHHHELLFEKCEGYTIYGERDGIGRLETACIGEIIFFDGYYDPKAPVRF